MSIGIRALRSRRLGALLVSGILLVAPFGPMLGLVTAGAAKGIGGLAPSAVLVGGGAVGALGIALTNLWLLVRWRHTLGSSYFNLVVEGSSVRRRVVGVFGVWLGPPLLVLITYYAVDLDPEAYGWLLAGLYAANWVSWLLPSCRTVGDYLGGGRVAVRDTAHVGPIAWKSSLPDAALLSLPLAPAVLALPWLTASAGLGAVVGGGVGSSLIGGLQWGLRRVTGQTWAQRAGLSG